MMQKPTEKPRRSVGKRGLVSKLILEGWSNNDILKYVKDNKLDGKFKTPIVVRDVTDAKTILRKEGLIIKVKDEVIKLPDETLQDIKTPQPTEKPVVKTVSKNGTQDQETLDETGKNVTQKTEAAKTVPPFDINVVGEAITLEQINNMPDSAFKTTLLDYKKTRVPSPSYVDKEDLEQNMSQLKTDLKNELSTFKNEVLEAVKTVNRHDDPDPIEEPEEETVEDPKPSDTSELGNPRLEPDRIRISKGSLVPKTVLLTPKTLMLYDIASADGYQGNISEYLNDVVKYYYEKRLGLTLGLLQKREIA